MEKLKQKSIYYICALANFYLLPLVIQNTGSAMIVMLMLMPLLNFLISLFYGSKHGFSFYYGLIIAILFIPTLFIFYNSSAWVYVIAHGLLALMANYFGSKIKSSKD